MKFLLCTRDRYFSYTSKGKNESVPEYEGTSREDDIRDSEPVRMDGTETENNLGFASQSSCSVLEG